MENKLESIFPFPDEDQFENGWMIECKFLKAIQKGTESILLDADSVPSLEQIEAVLLQIKSMLYYDYFTKKEMASK